MSYILPAAFSRPPGSCWPSACCPYRATGYPADWEYPDVHEIAVGRHHWRGQVPEANALGAVLAVASIIREGEMPNPFDDETAMFFVLVNDEGQYSLWPVFADIPSGWTVVYGEEVRKKCIAYIDESWVDMRPRSLAEAMAVDESDN